MRDEKRNNINWSMTSKHYLYKMDQQQHKNKDLYENKHQIYTHREHTMNRYKLTSCIPQLELKYASA